MSKLSRSVLKEIVKECIVEIFQESFLQPGSVMVSESRDKTKKRRPRNRKDSLVDQLSSYNQNESKMVKNESFDRKIEEMTSNMTSDPVFADIFKDTANTTLQSQMSAESSGGMRMLAGNVDSAVKLAQESDPTEIFAESANKWAALAFSEPTNK